MKGCRILVATLLLCSALSAVAAHSSPTRAPRNGKLAFVGANGDLVTANPDGSSLRRLTGSGRPGVPHCTYPCAISAVTWSPDGRRAAFLRGDLGSGPGCVNACRPPKLSLFVIGADGRGERRLSDCGGPPAFGDCNDGSGATRLSWSPDSSRIAFARRGLTVVDTRTGALRRLALIGDAPAWSPDGRSIAFIGASTLFTVNSVGRSRLRRFAQLQSIDNPAWAPDSTSLVFDGPEGIYSVRADGSGLTRLLSGSLGSGPYVPSFSPDGRHLLYFYTPGFPGHFTAEVWVMNPTGADNTRIYASKCCVGVWDRPIWSPDGTRIVMAADSAGGTLIMDVHGRHRHTLTTVSTEVAWQALP